MGQAKVKRSKKNTGTGKHDGKILNAMQWISCIYMLYLTVFFLLVCPEGFVNYDLYKRDMFIYPTLFFLGVEFVLWVLSLDDKKRVWLNYDKWYDRIDFVGLALIISWFIGYRGSYDKNAAFWGDSYRQVGFLFMACAVLVMIFIGHIGGWKRINTCALLISLFIVFQWQILNSFHVDPLNFRMDEQYQWLVASLANTDQNAMFDAVSIALLLALVMLSKKLYERIVCFILIAIGTAAAILVGAETFYLGLFVAFLILFGYSLKHTECLIGFAWGCAGMLSGVLLRKAGVMKWSSVGYGGTVLSFLDSTPVIVALAAGVCVLFLFAALYSKAGGRVHRVVHTGYTALVLGLSAVAIIVITRLYQNMEQAEGTLAGFLQDVKTRVDIDAITVRMFENQNLFHKIFGIGFGNYSKNMIRDFGEEMQARFGNQVLADSHSIYFDQLASGGVLGLILLIALFVFALVIMRKAAGKRAACIAGAAGTAAYLAAGIINFTLIVVTPMVFVMMGVFIFLARDAGEAKRDTWTD